MCHNCVNKHGGQLTWVHAQDAARSTQRLAAVALLLFYSLTSHCATRASSSRCHLSIDSFSLSPSNPADFFARANAPPRPRAWHHQSCTPAVGVAAAARRCARTRHYRCFCTPAPTKHAVLVGQQALHVLSERAAQSHTYQDKTVSFMRMLGSGQTNIA